MNASSKIQKTLTKVGFNDQKNDFAYWQSQPYEVRLATLEEIRQEYHAWKDKFAAPGGMMLNNQDFKKIRGQPADYRI